MIMNNAVLTGQEREFLWCLEEIESFQIAIGRHDFIELEDFCNRMKLDLAQALNLARSLAKKRFLILDHSSGNYRVKSRIGSVIKSIYHTTTLVQNRFVRDVSDLKYLRFVKQIPKLSIPLNKKETLNSLLTYLIDKDDLAKNILESAVISIASRFPTVSAFQLTAAHKILELLSKKEGNSLVIVAETGAGKTLAYQLPLLLWILNKKMKMYLYRSFGNRLNKILNCSALLLFPRNVLAKDQYDELINLNAGLNDSLKKLKIPSDLASFLQIKIEQDYGGVGLEKRTEIYQGCPDIIITNADTLKRRLMNPLCSPLYKKGVDLVLYDEVHLYYGLFGANVASLNARLQNLLPTTPVFIGMSATIANPQKHCQKLFSIKELPDIVTDREDVLVNYSLEHHVIVKPRAGRPSLGVCIDTTSALLHNRRDGMMEAHLLEGDRRPKTLCFVDSLDLAGRWTADQQNYEYFHRSLSVIRRFRRGYPIHFAPLSRSDPAHEATCINCKTGIDVLASICSEYQQGRCWWFSQDSGAPARWRNLQFGGVTPDDNIRVKRLTRQEVDLSELEDIYSLFNASLFDHEPTNLPADGLIATSVLEVGVDFKGIKEVVMYGEIRSPSSYKQKAGRGAREGNLDDGLFVMTVIPPSPLANFYYRHFYRLVYPSLSPLPLEPRNLDIVRSHAFCAVFDFLAMKGIDVFNVIAAKKDPKQVEEDFKKAILCICNEKERVNEFVIAYLRRLGYSMSQAKDIAEKAVENALQLLNKLSSEYEIKGDKNRLIIWIFEAFRDSGIMAALEDEIKKNLGMGKDIGKIADSKVLIAETKKKLLDAILLLGDQYASELIQIKQLLSEIEGPL
jgi:superfamily II DNA or RNA helicase